MEIGKFLKISVRDFEIDDDFDRTISSYSMVSSDD